MGARAQTRGASSIEKLVLLSAIALMAVGGYRRFGGKLQSKAIEQGDCVATLDCNSGTSNTSNDSYGEGDYGNAASGDSPSPNVPAVARRGLAEGTASQAVSNRAAQNPEKQQQPSVGQSVRDLLHRVEVEARKLKPLATWLPSGTHPFTAFQLLVTGPTLWVSGPKAPEVYGTPGPDTIPVLIRQNPIPYTGGSHAHAEVGSQGKPGAHSWSVESDWKLNTFNDGQKWWGTPVGTFHMTPAQLERFEAVYKLHTQGHKYRLGDSNLAMHSALIAAGFKEGVGHLYNPPAQVFGYFGYDNDPLLSRPAVQPRIPK